MPPLSRGLTAVLAALLTTVCAAPRQNLPAFPIAIDGLSEAGGFFNSDNLVSNERSYLHVVPELRAARLEGGVYIGVGPDQNFTYIAQTRPSMAFILDIRRDNLLLHLLFRALFRLADTRAEYLAMLFGRPVPAPAHAWKQADIERIVELIDRGPSPPDEVTALRREVDAVIARFGVPLSDADFQTIDRFHRTFVERGLDLQFESAGRPPRSDYPSYRQLVLETDRSGRRWHFLAHDADFQFVRKLQRQDLIIPVVGDLSGPTAMAAIASLLEERGERLSVVYASNAEYYLASRGVFEQFTANLRRFPRMKGSVIVRSIFPNPFGWAPTTPGYLSASVVQPVDELLDGVATGRIRGYGDLVSAR